MSHKNHKLKDRDPAKHKLIVDGLKQGLPIRAIAVAAEVGVTTVQNIKWDIMQDLPAFKNKLANRYAGLVEKLADRLDDQADKLTGRDIAVSLGIVHDKLALVADQPTAITRVEHTQLPDTNEVIKGLRSAKLSKDKTIIDVTPAAIEQSTDSDNRCPSRETTIVNDKATLTITGGGDRAAGGDAKHDE